MELLVSPQLFTLHKQKILASPPILKKKHGKRKLFCFIHFVSIFRGYEWRNVGSIFVFPFWSMNSRPVKGTSRQENKKNMRKLRQDAGKQGECLTLESSGELTKLKDHYFKQQNDENLLFITEKNNKLNQILIEGVVGKQVCYRVCVSYSACFCSLTF